MSESNKAQIELWNGRVGEKWAALQASLDAMLAHATAELKARVGSVAGQRVLDVGCGSGETCAIWLDGGAEVTGVDVSSAMLAVAAKRTGNRVTLVQADASMWRGGRPFDLAVSQFGLMFFADLDLAFANIAANLRPGGRLLFTCWRTAAENPWVSTPLGAIRELLPPAPPPEPHAPGPFALADGERLRGILARAGFADIAISPTGSALAEASQKTRTAAAQRLAVALAPYARDGSVTLGGAIWMVEAIRSR